MWPFVNTTRCTGRASWSRAAPNSCHCEGTISVSTTVRPSSSTITPALVWPTPPGSCSQAYTPWASCSSTFSSARVLGRLGLRLAVVAGQVILELVAVREPQLALWALPHHRHLLRLPARMRPQPTPKIGQAVGQGLRQRDSGRFERSTPWRKLVVGIVVVLAALSAFGIAARAIPLLDPPK